MEKDIVNPGIRFAFGGEGGGLPFVDLVLFCLSFVISVCGASVEGARDED